MMLDGQMLILKVTLPLGIFQKPSVARLINFVVVKLEEMITEYGSKNEIRKKGKK
jgi:hypothetical protein